MISGVHMKMKGTELMRAPRSLTSFYSRQPLLTHRQRTNKRPCRSLRGGRTCLASLEADSQVVYKDTPTDLAFIALCRIAYGRLAGWQSSRSWTDGPETFSGMVEVSRALMRVRGSSPLISPSVTLRAA
jgi:hypothetical protein